MNWPPWIYPFCIIYDAKQYGVPTIDQAVYLINESDDSMTRVIRVDDL